MSNTKEKELNPTIFTKRHKKFLSKNIKIKAFGGTVEAQNSPLELAYQFLLWLGARSNQLLQMGMGLTKDY